MEALSICVKEMVDAMKELESSKEDCKTRIDAAFATLQNEDEAVKNLGIGKKVLVKLAKSVVAGKIDKLSEEWEKTGVLIEKIFGIVKSEPF